MKKLMSWKTVLVVLGIGAAITLVMPEVATIAAITIIGLPLTAFLMLAPLLFLMALGTFLIGRKLGARWPAYVCGLVASTILLAIPPFFANGALERDAQALIAADHDDGNTVTTAGIIGLRYADRRHFPKGSLSCDGLCQRLLLNGLAKQVLVITQDITDGPDLKDRADSFRMEQGSSCPAVMLPQGHDPIKIANEYEYANANAKRIDELMQIAVASGNCLITEQAELGTADYVISIGRIRNGKSHMGAGLSLTADTIRADRIALHERRNVIFAETYRWTGVVTEKLFPLYAPTAIMGAQLQTETGLARYTSMLNITNQYDERSDVTGFFLKRLGFDLALRSSTATVDVRTILEKWLADKAATAMPSEISETYFGGLTRVRTMTVEDQALALAILRDERFPVPTQAWAAVQRAPGAEPQYFASIAFSMFSRLRALDRGDTGEKYPTWRKDAHAIGGVFRELPREAILPHKSDFEWLARRERLRVETYPMLVRLSEFGSEAGETLLWLIDDSVRFREKGGNPWQHPQLTGLIGFCKMGAAGKDFIQPLFDRLENGSIGNGRSYHQLVVHTLISLGADAEDIWRYAKPKDKKTDRELRLVFDAHVAKAKNRLDCDF